MIKTNSEKLEEKFLIPDNYFETKYYFKKQEGAFEENKINTFFISYGYEYIGDDILLKKKVKKITCRYKGFINYEAFFDMYSKIPDVYHKRFYEIITEKEFWVESYDIDKWYNNNWTDEEVLKIFLEKEKIFLLQ